MEWVETTGKTLDEAKEHALDRLGVAADEAEFDVLEEPRTGLFGRLRGEARVRARVKPTAVRPKQDRRGRGRNDRKRQRSSDRGAPPATDADPGSADPATAGGGRQRSSDRSASPATDADPGSADTSSGGGRQRSRRGDGRQATSHPPEPRGSQPTGRPEHNKEQQSMDEQEPSDVTPQEVGDAAMAFMSGLADAFGAEATVALEIDGTTLDVRIDGNDLGLLVGPGGRTLAAVQDLARVASQRRLGDHDTRLRIDVGGYREKRKAALEKFARAVAAQVAETGSAKALEPMNSADRKAVHDALADVDGVTSRSEGDDPRRRVVISPT